MSEPAIYKRKTKSGFELPAVTLEELQAMRKAGQKLQPDDLIQVIGVRSFVSDEKWLPASDYPELAEHFPEVAGRAIIEAEVKRAKNVRKYAIAAFSVCLLAAFLFWWMPYRDADDARGNLGRVTGELDSVRKDADDKADKLKALSDEASQREAALRQAVEDEKTRLGLVTAQLKRALAQVGELKGSGAVASSDVAELRSKVEALNRRLAEAERQPKFWPGAEAMRAPADAAQFRIVSMLPDKGYVYVVGSTRYLVGSLLLLKQSGLFGSKIHGQVVTIYEHANGDLGFSLQIPGYDEAAAKRLAQFSVGEVVDGSPVSQPK
jgi:hypothetical protein